MNCIPWCWQLGTRLKSETATCWMLCASIRSDMHTQAHTYIRPSCDSSGFGFLRSFSISTCQYTLQKVSLFPPRMNNSSICDMWLHHQAATVSPGHSFPGLLHQSLLYARPCGSFLGFFRQKSQSSTIASPLGSHLTQLSLNLPHKRGWNPALLNTVSWFSCSLRTRVPIYLWG